MGSAAGVAAVGSLVLALALASPAADTLAKMRRIDQQLQAGKRDLTVELARLAELLVTQRPDDATVQEATRILLRHPSWSHDDLGGTMQAEIAALGPAARPVLRMRVIDWRACGSDERCAWAVRLALNLLAEPLDAEVERALDELARHALNTPPGYYHSFRLLLQRVLVRRQSTDPAWVAEAVWAMRGDPYVFRDMVPSARHRVASTVSDPAIIRALWARLHTSAEAVHPGTAVAVWRAMGTVVPAELLASDRVPADAAQAVVLSETASRVGGEAARRAAASRIGAADAGRTPTARIVLAEQHLVLAEYVQAEREAAAAAASTLERAEFATAHLYRGIARLGLGKLADAVSDFDLARRAVRDPHGGYPNPWRERGPLRPEDVDRLKRRAASGRPVAVPLDLAQLLREGDEPSPR